MVSKISRAKKGNKTDLHEVVVEDDVNSLPSTAAIEEDADASSEVEELNAHAAELQDKILPLKKFLLETVNNSSEGQNDELVQYLQVKQQVLMSYCTNLMMYIMLKASGKSVKSHPVMTSLLELRYIIEKMRPLDNKLKYQIDKLMAQTPNTSDATDGNTNASAINTSTDHLRPNPLALFDMPEQTSVPEAVNTEPDTAHDQGFQQQPFQSHTKALARDDIPEASNVYKAPKSMATIYQDENDSQQKADKQKQLRKKLKHSELLRSMEEEYGHAPMSVSSGGVGAGGDTNASRMLKEEQKEREQFEEDRFVRLTLTKKQKQAIRKDQQNSNRFENGLSEMGKVDDLLDLEQLYPKAKDKGGSRGLEDAGNSNTGVQAMSLQDSLRHMNKQETAKRKRSSA